MMLVLFCVTRHAPCKKNIYHTHIRVIAISRPAGALQKIGCYLSSRQQYYFKIKSFSAMNLLRLSPTASRRQAVDRWSGYQLAAATGTSDGLC